MAQPGQASPPSGSKPLPHADLCVDLVVRLDQSLNLAGAPDISRAIRPHHFDIAEIEKGLQTDLGQGIRALTRELLATGPLQKRMKGLKGVQIDPSGNRLMPGALERNR